MVDYILDKLYKIDRYIHHHVCVLVKHRELLERLNERANMFILKQKGDI
jgi:hypothetical protein